MNSNGRSRDRFLQTGNPCALSEEVGLVPCSRTQPFLVLCPSLETKWQLLLCDIALPGTKLGHGNKRISYADDIVTQKLAQRMLLMWDIMSEWICEHQTLSLGYCWPLSFVICHHESSFGSALCQGSLWKGVLSKRAELYTVTTTGKRQTVLVSLQNRGGEQQALKIIISLICLHTREKQASSCYTHKVYLYESMKYY